ncbi:MAG: FtsX-like permease family protein, partial [Acidobacteriia bacterium]|nr:FtsX-like permease family protein [Terriglobia bacterium]
GRIVRQLLVESFALASAASIVGSVLAWLSASLLLGMLSRERLPVQIDLTINWHMLCLTILVCVLTTILFGLWPAIHASRTALDGALRRRSGGGSTPSTLRIGKGLAAAQIAISISVLSATGLMLATLHNLLGVQTGFQKQGMVLVHVNTLSPMSMEARRVLLKNVQRRLAETAGIEDAAFTNFGLFAGSKASVSITLPENPGSSLSTANECQTMEVSSRYFETMRIKVLSGRTFELRDMEHGSSRVALVNRAFANSYMDGQLAVGRRFSRGPADIPSEIIGVVEDIKYDSLREASPAMAYFPMRNPYDWMTIVVRSWLSPVTIAGLVRSVVPEVMVRGSASQEQFIEESMLRERALTSVSTAFGTVGLVLAAIGVFAVVSHSVSRRTHELAVRRALGAQRYNLYLLLLKNAALFIGPGLLLGLLLSSLVKEILGSLLFTTSADIVSASAGSALILSQIALVSSYLAARRTCNAEPAITLKEM